MSDWKEGKLTDVAEIVMGQSPKGETCNTIGNGLPLLNGPTEFGISNPSPVQYTTDAKKKSRINDLLFCVRGSVGKMNWSDKEYAIGRGIAGIRHKNGQEYKFFLKGIIDYNLSLLLQSATGSTFPNVSKKQLEGLEIQIPPLPEQRAIASVLSSLDDKIDLLHRQNETLEAMAETLFREWFVEGATSVKYRLEELVDSISTKHSFDKKSVVFLNTSDIYNGQVINHEYSKVKGLPGQAKKSIKKGDILFTEIRPANKRFAYIDFDAKDYVVSTKLMVLRSKQVLDTSIIYLFLKQKQTLAFLQMLAETRSGTFPQITFDHLKTIDIFVPKDEKILQSISKIFINILKKTFKNWSQIRTLSNLRDTLLPKLMSGKIRIALDESTKKKSEQPIAIGLNEPRMQHPQP